MTLKMPPAIWFWIVALLLLLWNLAGLAAFLTELFAPDLVTDSFNADQLDSYNNRPAWYLYNYAIAVTAGTFACVLLLVRKKFAVTLSIISFIAVLISTIYTVYSGSLALVGMLDRVLFYAILVLDIVLVIFARYAVKRRWII